MKKTIQSLTAGSLAVALLLGMGGCADMSRRDRDTALGAGAGAVVGSVLTDGSAAGTIGGAVVGGVIGDQAGKKR
jgi:osmotically inducible lipoprotein OsmB